MVGYSGLRFSDYKLSGNRVDFCITILPNLF